MHFNSPCKACNHPHDGLICSYTVHHVGTIHLRSYNNSFFGVQGGYVKGYDQYGASGQEQLTFKPFEMGREESFEYRQDHECGCMFYVPSENLEFLEWKYNASLDK